MGYLYGNVPPYTNGCRDAYEEKLVTFKRNVISIREKKLIGQIQNADQMPVFFEMPAESTINTEIKLFM